MDFNTHFLSSQVEAYSNRVANFFLAQGLKKGDSVALMLENRPEFVCLWLGLSKLGVITALINHNLRQNSLLHCINIAGVSAFIYGAELTDGKLTSNSVNSRTHSERRPLLKPPIVEL
jgi:Acyl-CoA synthetases (AMP-forming)/AMP-acid ligases II